MSNSSLTVQSLLKEFINRYPKHFIVLFLILVFEGIVSGLAVISLIPLGSYLVDPELKNPNQITSAVREWTDYFGLSSSFWTYGMIFVALNAAKGLFDIGIRHAVLRIKYAVTRGLFEDTLNAFFKARWEFFSSTEQGKLLSTLNKELVTIGDALGAMAIMLAQTIQLLIYGVIPLWLNPVLTLTTLSLAVLVIFPFLLFQKLSYRLGKLNTETANIAMNTLTETLAAARLVIGFGRQREARDRYLAVFDQHVNVTLKSQTLSVMVPSLYRPFGMLAAMIAMGIALQKGGQIAELGAVMWSLLALLPMLVSLLHGNISIKNFIPSFEQLMQLKRDAESVREIEGTKIFSELKTGIELRNLTFTYAGRNTTIRCLNLSIKRGQMTALVGESGSGKSTISDLILGLQIPQEGQVLLDNLPLGEWKQNTFREKIGYVPQDPFLFGGSIRENLLWSYPQATEKELWDCLKLSHAAGFVQQLPEGINTIVGDRGTRLSGGQRQRIALARALLRNPELLILDEATSALDSESEFLIQGAIENLSKNTTILIIAHRLSTISKADKIYVLNAGQVLEEGHYEGLIQKEGSFFSKMAKAQSPRELLA